MEKNIEPLDRNDLLQDITQLIEQTQTKVAIQSNHLLIILFWQVGKRINEEILHNKRADYGAQIVSTLSTQLKNRFGRNFELRNLRRMMQFAEQFEDFEIVVTLSRQLSWSHILILLPLKNRKAQLYYASNVVKAFLKRHRV